jgi:SSS family solute:Na+ symporter
MNAFHALLAVYLGALVALSWSQRRRATSPLGFYLGDRRFGPLPTGFSLAATTIGASAVLTQGELIYTHGLAGVWMDLSGALGLAALAAWLVPKVRAGGSASLAEVAGLLFGPAVRRTAALLILLAEVGWLALLLRGAQSILAAAGQTSPGADLALAWIAVVAVTCLGGQHAVTWSDVVQLCVMSVGIVGLGMPAAMRALAAGAEPAGAAASGAAAGAAALNFPWGEGWPAWRAGEMLLMVGLPHLVGSDVYAKILAARDDASARRGAWLAAAAKAVFGLSIALIALAARRALPDLEPASAAVPAWLMVAMPAGIDLLILLALMAVILSSADTVLLTGSTVLLHDLWPGSAARAAGGADVRHPAPVARTLTVVGLAAAALLLATRLHTMMAAFTWAYSLFAAGLSLPILAGLALGPRLPAHVARAGMVCGAACAAGAGLLGLPLPVLDGLAGCLAAMLLSAFAARRGRWTRHRESFAGDSAPGPKDL